MGLLSFFGASPETESRFQKGLLDIQMAFPELRRQKMEEDQAASDAEWKKRQRQMQEEQYAQGQSDRQRSMNDDALIQRLYGMPTEGAMPQGQAGPGMPTPNAGIDPQTFLRQGGSVDRLPGILGLNSAVTPKRVAPVISKPGDIARGEDGGILWQNPEAAPKPEAAPSAVREYQFAKEQGYPGTFEQWTTSQKRAGASSVSVNTGQRGLDNTLKLRGDFRSEPVYKAHQEMQSAFSQIKQALGQASPAGDLAGATKIMKLLDPGSVVRESELGMAMAASGLLDRVENYAKNIVQGTKLTPTQRKDFLTLANALYGESVKSYNAKRQEYQGIAERNQLSVPDVLGPTSSMPEAGNVDDLVNKYRSK